MRVLTRLEGRVPALHALLTRSHAKRFDALAPKWDTIRSDVGDSQRMLERALDELGVTAPAHVLDVGTGTGQAAGILLGRFPEAQIDAVDASSRMIELARAKPELKDVRFEVADGGRLPYPDAPLRPGGLPARAAVRGRAAPRARAGRLGALLLPDGAGHADLVPDGAGRAAARARRLLRGAFRHGRSWRMDRGPALSEMKTAGRAREAPARRGVPGAGRKETGDHELPARLTVAQSSGSMLQSAPTGKG